MPGKARYAEMSDDELVKVYRSTGDMNALSNLVQRYTALIFAVCMKYLKDPIDSEDAASDIFTTLHEKLGKHDVQSFKSWLYVLTRNHCLQILRNRTRERKQEEDYVMHSAPLLHHDKEDYATEQDFNDLEDCMGRLSGEQGRSIRLFYYDALSYDQIADQLGVAKEKVRSFIQNGRRNLRNCMEQKHEKRG